MHTKLTILMRELKNRQVQMAQIKIADYIASCKTEEHLKATDRMLTLFRTLYPQYKTAHTTLSCKHQMKRIDICHINASLDNIVLKAQNRESIFKKEN